MVSGRKNQSIWPKGPCCEALHCISSSTLCSACGYFTSGWLLASLARCICWRHFRFVFCDCSSSVWHLYFFWESITDCIHLAAFFCFSGLVVASFCYLQFFPPPCDVDGMYYATIYYFFITLIEYMYIWESPCATPFWLLYTHLHYSLKCGLQKEWGVFISV